MQVMSGAPEGLPQGLYSKMARYRHKVFVEQLGWGLQTQDGAELDQFDRQDTVYVVAQDDEGHVFGCARLLPVNNRPRKRLGYQTPNPVFFKSSVALHT